jgi:pheromone a factor receptor
VSGPPVIVGCISAVYGGAFLIFYLTPYLLPPFLVLSLLAFNRSRKQFNELLSGSNLTKHRYVRLMCLAGCASFGTLVLGTYVLIHNCTAEPVQPWRGWADTHYNFSRVAQYPSIIWRYSGLQPAIELSRWLGVICAFTFFAFFGFAEEARKNYQSALRFLTKRIGTSSTAFSTIGSFGPSFFNSSGYVRILTSWPISHLITLSRSTSGIASAGNPATLPVYIQNHTIRKVDDLDSISDMSVSIHDEGGALSDEKIKRLSSDLSYDAMSFSDVGGTLVDHTAEPYTPSSSSASSTYSLSPRAAPPPGLPHSPLARRPDSTIEISSVRHLDVDERPIRVLQPVLDISSAPRHATDTPSGVHRNTHDMV